MRKVDCLVLMAAVVAFCPVICAGCISLEDYYPPYDPQKHHGEQSSLVDEEERRAIERGLRETKQEKRSPQAGAHEVRYWPPTYDPRKRRGEQSKWADEKERDEKERRLLETKQQEPSQEPIAEPKPGQPPPAPECRSPEPAAPVLKRPVASMKARGPAREKLTDFHLGIWAALASRDRIKKKPSDIYLIEAPDAFFVTGVSAYFELMPGTVFEEIRFNITEGSNTVRRESAIPFGSGRYNRSEGTISLCWNAVIHFGNRKKGPVFLSDLAFIFGGGPVYECGYMLRPRWGATLNLGAGYFGEEFNLRLEWVFSPGSESVTSMFGILFGIPF